MKVRVINGPNLNMLGIREPEIYGSMTLEALSRIIEKKAKEGGVEIDFFQSNSEGELIDAIQSCFGTRDGLIINAGAYTHYSYALRDAISAIALPTVEVHLSDIEEREEFRKKSVIRDVCVGRFMGEGVQSYIHALELLAQIYKGKAE